MPGGDRRGSRVGPQRGGRGLARGVGYGGPEYCVCPKCGARVKHQRGVSCPQMQCPKCKTPLVR